MINVNQITSQLAKMPDQALQQYAAMHKNDPYTVSLALAESNRRKQMRTGAQMNFEQQPKVVDQEIAGMASPEQAVPQQALPEDSGIGQLPAQNIQGMAGGGIVAFEEGGAVPRFQVGGTPQALPGGLGIYSQGSFAPQAGDAALQKRIADIEANPRMQRADKDMLIAKARQEFGLPKTTTIPPTKPVQFSDKPAATNLAPAATTTTQTSPRTDSNNVVDQALARKKVEEDAAAKGQKPPVEPGLPSVNAYLKQFEANLPAKEKVQTEEAFMNKRAEPMKEYFDKANANIQKETARLKTDKEQDFYMSLIQGGLAAAAETGPNALQNIAKGFSVGAGSYKDALKDFRKATQENSRMEMDLMKAKAADKKGDMDAFQRHTEAVAERNVKIDQLKASGVASLLGQNLQATATLGAAKYGRDSMNEYRNQSQVETIRKNIDAKLGDDPKYKFNAAARALEVERRLQAELQRYPNLVGYAGTPTGGGAAPALRYNEKTGKIE
jgi:hypothetical protein